MPKKKTVQLNITPKQKNFVLLYTSFGDTYFNGLKSAKAAGYKGSDAVMSQIAHANLRNSKIHAEIRRVTREMYSANDITIERVLSDLEMLKSKSLEKDDLATAFKCIEAHGKYLKMFAERVDHVHSIESVGLDVLQDMALSLAGKIDGFDITGNARRNGARKGSVSNNAGTKPTH